MNKTTSNNSTTDNVVPIQAAPKKKIGRPKKDPNAPKVKNPNMNNNPEGIGLYNPKMIDIKPGDTNNILQINLRIYDMPPIKLTDPPSVKARIAEYFQLYADYDMKPTLAGLAMALGTDRRRLWEIKVGQYKRELPPETEDYVKKAYMILENMWESYMNSGKINPVSGIFLGKNHFNYQDKTEYVVTPNTQSEMQYSEEDIRKRYMLDEAEPIETSAEDI